VREDIWGTVQKLSPKYRVIIRLYYQEDTNFIPVFQIVSGYVFITCLYKNYEKFGDTE